MIKKFLRNKLSIVLLAVTILVVISTAVYASNIIRTTLTGSIEIVTSSGGGGGGTTPPDPADITVLNVLNFTDVPTTSNTTLVGQIVVQNDTGSDLYYLSANITLSSIIGEMSVSHSGNTTTVFSGDTQTLDISYTPAGGGMPLGNYSYSIDLDYAY